MCLSIFTQQCAVDCFHTLTNGHKMIYNGNVAVAGFNIHFCIIPLKY